MSTIPELRALMKTSLGTKETVNFYALRRLLYGILRMVDVTNRKTEHLKLPDDGTTMSMPDEGESDTLRDADAEAAAEEAEAVEGELPAQEGSSDEMTRNRLVLVALEKKAKDKDATKTATSDEVAETPKAPHAAKEDRPAKHRDKDKLDPDEDREGGKSMKKRKITASKRHSRFRHKADDKVDGDALDAGEEKDRKPRRSKAHQQKQQRQVPSDQDADGAEEQTSKSAAQKGTEGGKSQRGHAAKDKSESQPSPSTSQPAEQQPQEPSPEGQPEDGEQKTVEGEQQQQPSQGSTEMDPGASAGSPTTPINVQGPSASHHTSADDIPQTTIESATETETSYNSSETESETETEETLSDKEAEKPSGRKDSSVKGPKSDQPRKSSTVKSRRESDFGKALKQAPTPKSASQEEAPPTPKEKPATIASGSGGSVKRKGSSTGNIYISAEDFTGLPSPTVDVVTRQDLDDLDKRLKNLEFDMSKAVLANKTTSAIDKQVDHLEKRERTLHKYIEMVEKDNDERLQSVWKEIRDMKKQLQHLPHPKELHKSFFPSWKMIEDGICSHPILKQNIEDAKQDPTTSSNKQLSKFLGPSGPSERLLEAFKVLSGIIEQGRSGVFDQMIRELAEAKMMGTFNRKRTPAGSGWETPTFRSRVSSTDEKAMDTDPIVLTLASPPEASLGDVQPDAPSGLEQDKAVEGKAGYLGFKVAKLVEETVGIRKELNDMQLWKDRLNSMEDDLRELADLLMSVRRDLDAKDEKDNDVMINLQMDVNELHREICGLENKKITQARKAEMDVLKKDIQQEARITTMSDVVIDREARIRTQQLQMQLNAMHNMLAEIEARLPADFSYNPQPQGLPDTMMHPWGTGRAGAGVSLRSGAGTAATTCQSTNKTSPSSPPGSIIVSVSSERPAPLGRAESGHVANKSQDTSFHDKEKDREEKTRTQFAITRLNQSQSDLKTRLEACQNQQTAELKRLQDLMTRMHKEYMLRCSDIQDQLVSIVGENMEESDWNEPTAQKTGEKSDKATGGRDTTGLVMATTPGSHHQGTRPGSASKQGVSPEMLLELRKELMGYLKALRKRVRGMEVPYFGAQEVEPALLKKPVVHRFQCLSCDKRVDLAQPRGDGFAPSSVVPELPRLPMITSPRCRLKGQAARPQITDCYMHPRQCGGSYTSTTKPRRTNFTDLGETADRPDGSPTEKVDVRGTDGHIYKGQVKMLEEASRSFLPILPPP